MKAQARPGDEVSAGAYERLGPYRLVHQIGEGGMGVVHLALDPQGRAVAIKVLRPHIAYDPDARSRLEREVDTLARIDHERVAAVIDSDIFGARPYLVTRYVPGPSLDEVVAEQGPLSGDALLRVGRGLVGALDAIHRVGVVHRDLKPGNVLLEDGDPVVIDFGIAHVADDIRLTSVGLVMGTPGYLSPELIEGAEVTEATDWWGWAATLAFAASGRPPFGRGPMDAVLDRVRRGQSDLTGVDPRLTPLLTAALSPDPAARPPASEVVSALERYAVGGPATVAIPHETGPDRPEPTSAGHTAVLPQSPVPWDADAWPSEEWAQPAGQRWAPDSDEPWDEDESDWQAAWEAGPGEPDPRIGRPMRTGTIALLALALAAAAMVWPGVTLVVVLVWCWVARFCDRSVTALVLRRHDRGRRRSDVPMAVVLSPWHVLASAAGTVVGLLLPAVVALATTFSAVLGISSVSALDARAATAPALALGFLAGSMVSWWGPGGVALRRGSRSMVRGVVRPGTATQVVVAGLVVAAVALCTMAVIRHGDVSWAPLPGDPGRFFRSG